MRRLSIAIGAGLCASIGGGYLCGIIVERPTELPDVGLVTLSASRWGEIRGDRKLLSGTDGVCDLMTYARTADIHVPFNNAPVIAVLNRRFGFPFHSHSYAEGVNYYERRAFVVGGIDLDRTSDASRVLPNSLDPLLLVANTSLFTVVTYVIMRAVACVCRHLRKRGGRCEQCGYALDRLPGITKCPECGSSVRVQSGLELSA